MASSMPEEDCSGSSMANSVRVSGYLGVGVYLLTVKEISVSCLIIESSDQKSG
jgi:hypothetical protein